MCKVISFANQKGGVGKTTLSFNFAAILAQREKKVLLIDMDSQANLTAYFGIADPSELTCTVGHVIRDVIADGEINMEELKILVNNRLPNLCLLGANAQLYQIKQILMEAEHRESVLREAIEELKPLFDYIIIDCAPSLDIDLVNALVASDEVIIVATPSRFSYSGSEELMRSIARVKRGLNPELSIAGVVCNRVDNRNRFMPEMVSAMRSNWQGVAKVFETEIPNSVRVDESQLQGVALSIYERNNQVTIACQNLVNEYLEGGVQDEQ